MADTVVHPDYRGKRISSRMIDYINNYFTSIGVQITYWVSSNPIFISKGKQRRIPLPFKVTNYVRILNIEKQLKAMPVPHPFLTKTGYFTVKAVNRLKNGLKKDNNSRTKFEICEIKSFEGKMKELTVAVSSNHSFIVEKDHRYLNWRYTDNRAGRFTVKVVLDANSGKILGYCIMRINHIRQDYPVGFIMDLIALPGRLDVVDTLLDQAINYFDGQGINIVNILHSEKHPHKKALNKKGFLNSRMAPFVFINTLGRETTLGHGSNAPGYFSFGDIDTLPTQIPRAKSN